MSQNINYCQVLDCVSNKNIRTFTHGAKKKSEEKGTFSMYSYLNIDDKICQKHYLIIVEPDRNIKKKTSSSNFYQINLSNLLKNKNDNSSNSFENWSDIKIDMVNDKPNLTKDNFDLLLQKISNMESELNVYRNNQISEFNKFSYKLKTLSDSLFYLQRDFHLNLELNPDKFRIMIENYQPILIGFFDELIEMFVPTNRSELNKENAKKNVVVFCYLLAGLRNKFINSLQLEIGLYLSSSGATVESIDLLSKMGISVSHKTVERLKQKIEADHPNKINDYLLYNSGKLFCFNLDDYHSIHSFRAPNTTTLSTAHHMATCTVKTIEDSEKVLVINNGVHINNPKNIEALRIIKYLHNEHIYYLEDSYNVRKSCWLQNKKNLFDGFDRIELLTVHYYDYAIEQRKNDRSMKNTHIVNIKEQNLKNLDDYLEALKMITNISTMNEYLQHYVIPIVADFPGQLFIRRAISLYQKSMNDSSNNLKIPKVINSFIPLLGPLHVSLNMRESTILTHWNFFEQLYKFVFGKNKKLAKKPMPWKINTLLDLTDKGWKQVANNIIEKFGRCCKDTEYRSIVDLLDNIVPAVLDIYAIIFRSGSCEEYVETIFRLWTFALRWDRKNYNKLPLAFLSDFFYWKDNKHPFYDAIRKHLVNFNDYYVENWHSRMRANTSSQSSSKNIIKQTLVLDGHEQILVDTFKTFITYPYTESNLNYLTNRASLFLIKYFYSLYNKQNQTIISNKNKIYFAALNQNVKLKNLPAAFHTSFRPLIDSCDHCKQKFVNNYDLTGLVLICGHGYHLNCYNTIGKNCNYCLKFYENGITTNVKSYVNRLEKEVENNNEMLNEEIDDDNEDENDTNEIDTTTLENIEIIVELENALNQVINW